MPEMQIELFSVMLVFLRLGAALTLMPGIGEATVSTRIRLVLAILLSVALAPTIENEIPAMPDQPAEVVRLVAIETMIGAMLGTMLRFMVSALHTAGVVIAMQSGLATAMMYDPNQQAQGALPGNFLSALALVLLFSSGMHLMMLDAVAQSYQVFPVGEALPLGDAAQLLGRLLDAAFVLATQVAAPLLLVGTLFQVALGLLARLMPTIQVFFIAIPIQMLIGLSILAITLSAAMLVWLDRFGMRLDSMVP
ncbi:flagellar biosynthetic protein FliR [Tistrella sp. BH-R2-4]|uniref:Flagellar biosynthetic protein FliR n=1 Tax=Tistrella arctica TaxID=3133430 RepID=A0ABU9YI99_9PROT